MMTTGNGGYGLSMMDTVATHEMGHSFYAVDEYDSPGYAECSCNDGYNGCKNRNCMKGCGLNMPCMMRHNEDGLCTDTVCHVGWKCQCSTGACCDGCGYRPGSVCRAKAGDCDLAEFCTGGSTSCPADKFKDTSYLPVSPWRVRYRGKVRRHFAPVSDRYLPEGLDRLP